MPSRPRLRRDRLPEVYVYTLRLNLEYSKPPIWRRIEVRSDITLETLHNIIQPAFGWWNYHLFRFSLGGGPYDWESELFLCDFDANDGDDEGTHVSEVRIDETLQNPDDVLRYIYDYGDDWLLKIKLEKVRLAAPEDPIACCVGGRRAAPPEDCGGLRDAQSLAGIIDDPSYFNVDETTAAINEALATPEGYAPASLLSEKENEEQDLLLRFPQFKEFVDACYYTPGDAQQDVYRRLRMVESNEHGNESGFAGTEEEIHEAFGALLCLLDGVGSGIRLTNAGYLPPNLALAVADELGLKGHERSRTGESQMIQVAHLREAMQKAGLLRKLKGDLLPTKAAKDGREKPSRLWNHLADRLLPKVPKRRDFAHEAALVSLLVAATSDGEFDLDLVASMLSESGWRLGREPVTRYDIAFNDSVWQVVLLWFIAPKDERDWFPGRISPAAVHLAHAGLIGMTPVVAG